MWTDYNYVVITDNKDGHFCESTLEAWNTASFYKKGLYDDVSIEAYGVTMPETDDYTFFCASVEAAKEDKVWCEEAHAFVTKQFKSAIDGGCVELDDLNEEFTEVGGWEAFVIENIYCDVFGYTPMTGDDGTAIIRDKDVAELAMSHGFEVRRREKVTDDPDDAVWWEATRGDIGRYKDDCDEEEEDDWYGEDEKDDDEYDIDEKDLSDDIGWDVDIPEYRVLEPTFRATWDRFEKVGHLELGVPATKYVGGWKLKAHVEVYSFSDLEEYIRILRADPDQLEIVDGEVVLHAIDKKEHLIDLAKSQGWYLNPETTDLVEDDCLSYEVGDGDDVTGYTVIVDPYNGTSSHKGHGKGCFWTAWE